MFRRRWQLLILLGFSAGMVAASTQPTPARPIVTLQDRELRTHEPLLRVTRFADVPHTGTHPSCDDVQPPQPLTTPSPILTAAQDRIKVEVSFIVGTDGRVHSPLILESAGAIGDRRVLQTVRTWRYRPATCNGIPTETEGKIEFSVR